MLHKTSPVASRFILYARKSNEREDRQVTSLADQSKLARAEAARKGIRIIQEIPESKSAKLPGKRPGFADMVARIEDGLADGIICWHPDRLSRNSVDGAWIIDLLDRGKLRDIHFLTYRFDNTPEGKLALANLFSQAKYFVDKLSVDVGRGMSERREEGRFPHYVPEGYKNICREDGRKDIVIDSERFVMLRRAVDLILTETYSPAQVMRLLNGWGYRTRTTRKRPGAPLRDSSFYRILHNPFYCGRCRSGDTWYQGLHKPLMSVAEFRQVQHIIGRRGVLVFRKHERSYARGLFTCGFCGCQITSTFARGRHQRGSYVYYHCTTRKGGCTRAGTREEVVESAVSDLLQNLSLPPSLVPHLIDMTHTALRNWEQIDSEADIMANGRLAAARAERDRLLPLLLKGVLTEEAYAAGLAKLDTEIDDLESQAAAISGQVAANCESATNVVNFAAESAKVFAMSGPQVKRRIVQLLCSKRVLTPHKPLLELHPYTNVLTEFAPQLRVFKPLESGSDKPKESLPGGTLYSGRPNINRIETLDDVPGDISTVCQEAAQCLAKVICSEGVYFPALSLAPEFAGAPTIRRPARA